MKRYINSVVTLQKLSVWGADLRSIGQIRSLHITKLAWLSQHLQDQIEEKVQGVRVFGRHFSHSGASHFARETFPWKLSLAWNPILQHLNEPHLGNVLGPVQRMNQLEVVI